MVNVGNQHKTIPVNWVCHLFPSKHFTLVLVVTNIDKYNKKFVTTTFDTPSL